MLSIHSSTNIKCYEPDKNFSCTFFLPLSLFKFIFQINLYGESRTPKIGERRKGVRLYRHFIRDVVRGLLKYKGHSPANNTNTHIQAPLLFSCLPSNIFTSGSPLYRTYLSFVILHVVQYVN